MDYKEKLKEALNSDNTDYEVVRWIEQNFPELKESKDERIRKELIEFVKSRGGFKQEYIAWLKKQVPACLSHDDEIMIRQLTEYFTTSKGLQNTNDTVVEWLADVKRKLEKQGEHKKFRDSIQIGDKVTKNEDGVLVNLSQLKRVAKKDEKQGEQKPAEWEQENVEELTEFENAMMHIGVSFFGENAGLNPNDTDSVKEQAQYLLELAQKPAEWTERDSKISNAIIKNLGSSDALCVDLQEAISWVSSVKERVQSQPKQEWSEEDKDKIVLIEKAIYSLVNDGITSTDATRLCEWLKSLRTGGSRVRSR